MEFNADDVTIVHNDKDRLYSAEYQGASIAFCAYAEDAQARIRDFNHTVTQPEYGGHGLAGKVVRHALEDSISNGFSIQAGCSYVEHFIEKNPEYKEHLA